MKSLLPNRSSAYIYRAKLRDVADEMARFGYECVDEFSLRKELFTDIDELCGYYIKSLSSGYQNDYLVNTKNHDKIGNVLADYLISNKSDDEQAALLACLSEGAVDMAMDRVIEDINMLMPYAVEDMHHWAAVEASTPVHEQHYL